MLILNGKLCGANCAGSLVFASALALLCALDVPDASAQPFTERNSDQDFNTLGLAGSNKNPVGLCAVKHPTNGRRYMLVSDSRDGKIYAYDLATKARLDSHHTTDDDFDLTSKNSFPVGIWTDDTTLWVAEGSNFTDVTVTNRTDVTVTNRVGTVVTNTVTNIVTERVKYKREVHGNDAIKYSKIFAYTLSWTNVVTWTNIHGVTQTNYGVLKGDRDTSKEFWLYHNGTNSQSNISPTGLWSDETTLWVANSGRDRIFAYTLANGIRDESKEFDLEGETGEGEKLEEQGNTFAQGIWSDGETMWVSDFKGIRTNQNKKIFAYKLELEEGETEANRRVPSKDYGTLKNAGNERPRGLWSDGKTMWVADKIDNKIYAYHGFRASASRNSNEDFNTLKAAGNINPGGLWSNRTNLWVSDSVRDKLFAYDLISKKRNPAEDFSLETLRGAGSTNNTGNTTPTALWSDGVTMWVVDETDKKIYAYEMEDKTHDSTKGIVLTAANAYPAGLWSNGSTMWVSDFIDEKLYGYNMWTNNAEGNLEWDGSYDSEKNIDVGSLVVDVDTLFLGGLWSDGETMWVADHGGGKIYAVTLPQEGRAAARAESEDYDTLAAAGNSTPTGLWSDGDTMWVLDGGNDKIYAYNTLKVEARLGELNVNGHIPNPNYEDFVVDLDPTFNRGTTNYTASVPYATESLTVSPKTLRPVIDTTATSFHHSLTVGANTISIIVTNGHASSLPRTRTYKIEVTREFFTHNAPDKDIMFPTNFTVQGIWANETNLWVATIGTNKLYAYNKANRTRDVAHDIPLATTNVNPRGLWSDGTTMWIADAVFTNAMGKKKLFAYKMSDGDPDAAKDIDLAKTTMPKPTDEELKNSEVALEWQTELKNNDNSHPEWIWSDGAIMWVSDTEDKKIYAYNMSDKSRNKSREIDLAALSEANDSPQGLWSDGENLWVANDTRGNVKLYAYKLAGERIDCREETKDFNTLEAVGNTDPKAIFSDGATMYVVDSDDGKIYAYNQPLSDNASLRRVELSDVYYEGKTFNDYFQTERRLDFYPHAYVPYSTNATTTVSNIETQDPRVNFEKQGDDLLGWKIQSPADDDPNTAGHQVRLTAGDTTAITILVTAQSGATREHIIRIANDPSGPLPFRNIDYTGGSDLPTGLWGNGTTMWITGSRNILFAYKMDENNWGAVDTEKQHKLVDRNRFIRGLWGDETTIWTANWNSFPANPYFRNTTKIYGYYRTTDSEGNLNRNSAQDFTFAAANSQPAGLWSDGTTMYVGDRNTISNQWKIFAYNLNSKAPDSTKDISIGALGESLELLDFWSNQTNFWVLLNNDGENQTKYSSPLLNEDRALYAYKWGEKDANGNAVRDSSRDIPLRKGVSSSDYLKGAMAIFAHDMIMYVSNRELWQSGQLTHYRDFKVHAYGLPTSLPESASDPSAQSGPPENLILKGLSLSGISLSPVFSPDHLDYTASVEFDVASTTVTATPNDSEASVSIFWGTPAGATSEISGQGPQVSLQEGDNGIAIEVTAGDGFSRLFYGVGITKLAPPPVSGGPLPLSFQPSSSAMAAGKSRLIAVDSLPNGGLRFVFLAPNAEVEVESSLDLTAGSWSPLPNSQFQIRRQETFDSQTILTLILPKADEKQRFLRLIPRRK